MDYEKMKEYVKKTLEEHNAIKPKKKEHGFRSRYTHTLRVLEWCKRIENDFDDVNKEILYTSAIFHDIGYSLGKENHANSSVIFFEKYAKENNFPDSFISEVSKNISLHSNKGLLKDPSTSKELILLLEADLLDEEGCLGIVWDLLAKGALGASTYEDSLEEVWKHSGHILTQDFMVTPLAKKYWDEKKMFVRDFLNQFEKDLFMGE